MTDDADICIYDMKLLYVIDTMAYEYITSAPLAAHQKPWNLFSSAAGRMERQIQYFQVILHSICEAYNKTVFISCVGHASLDLVSYEFNKNNYD